MRTIKTKTADDGTELALKKRNNGEYVVTESGSGTRTGEVMRSREAGERQLRETSRLYGNAERADRNQQMGGFGPVDDGSGMGGGFGGGLGSGGFGDSGMDTDPLRDMDSDAGLGGGFGGSIDSSDGSFGDGGFDGNPFGDTDSDAGLGADDIEIDTDAIRERTIDAAGRFRDGAKSLRDRFRR